MLLRSSTLLLSTILIAPVSATVGDCVSNPLLPSIPLTDKPRCLEGFLCLSLNATQPRTWPAFCAPDVTCQRERLLGNTCSVQQGKYEPSLCPAGSYCPLETIDDVVLQNNVSVGPAYVTPQMIQCPEGSYCLAGSSAPLTCPAMTVCPAGSSIPVSWNGLLACIIVDVALVIAYLICRTLERKDRSILNALQKALWHSRSKAAVRSTMSAESEDMEFTGVAPQRPMGARDYYDMQTLSEPASPAVRSPIRPVHLILKDKNRKPMGDEANHALQQVLSVYSQAYAVQANSTAPQLRFQFEALTLNHPVKGKPAILGNVTGTIQAAKTTAILGVSGGGKTSFLNVLMGKVTRSSGQLLINGCPAQDMTAFKSVIGYVPQEDIMIRTLTVRENLLHSANVRLPATLFKSSKERETFVDAVIDLLDLTRVRNVVIGDELVRGISGGQRKRVNIGLELVACPLALFLDEPTSGLDSTAALTVMRALRDIAQLGVTVVSVIHQPRYEIFASFDDLLLLVKGGRTGFMGPQRLAMPYFRQRGFLFPEGINPADVLIDILSCKGQSTKFSQYNEDNVVEWWTSTGGVEGLRQAFAGGGLQISTADSSPKSGSETSTPLVIDAEKGGVSLRKGANLPQLRMDAMRNAASQSQNQNSPNISPLRPLAQSNTNSPVISPISPMQNIVAQPEVNRRVIHLAKLRGAPFYYQVYLCHIRSLRQQYRDIISLVLETLVGIVAGFIMGLLVVTNRGNLYRGLYIVPYVAFSPVGLEYLVPLCALLSGFAISLASSSPGVRVFADEKFVFWREAAAGHDRIAYFVGKWTGSWFRIGIAALHYATVFHFLILPQMTFSTFYALIIGVFYSIYGLSAAVSTLLRRENAPLLSAVVCLFTSVFCGYGPSLNQARKWGVEFVYNCSYNRWFAEAFYTSELEPFSKVYQLDAISQPIFGYQLYRFSFDVGMIYVVGTAYWLLACILLLVTNRSKQR